MEVGVDFVVGVAESVRFGGDDDGVGGDASVTEAVGSGVAFACGLDPHATPPSESTATQVTAVVMRRPVVVTGTGPSRVGGVAVRGADRRTTNLHAT